MTCTFFGHAMTPVEIKPLLKETIMDLIIINGVKNFYVGNHGEFDYMVHDCLIEVKEQFPEINYAVVLAYLPTSRFKELPNKRNDTIYPEGLEKVPRRFAINKRNEWMIRQSDYVVTYVKHSLGGSSNFKEMAEKRGKIVINLA